MLKLVTNVVIAGMLTLSASVAAPAWSADRPSASQSKCPYAKHKHAKRTMAAPKAQPARGVTLVEHRKMDVQILSFGP